jgi:hypothetical protein
MCQLMYYVLRQPSAGGFPGRDIGAASPVAGRTYR